MGLLLFYLFLALSVSFLCSVMEAVLLTTPMSFVSMKEEQGVKAGALFKRLKQNIDRPLSAILSLNTIAHTIGAAGVGAQATLVFNNISFGLISATLTILILVFSEILPKTIGAYYWKSIAMGSAKIINIMVFITYPLVVISEGLTKIISKGGRDNASVSREEFSAMVNIGEEEGLIGSAENRIIQNIIKLRGVKVEDVMTPRVVVETASEEMTIEEFHNNKNYRNFSRIPIYSSTGKEDIIGFVHRQDVIENVANDNFGVKLKSIKREITVVPNFQPLTVLWERLLSKKAHIALVVDEYGGFEGIVTLEDVIETILGLEIMDERDVNPDMQQYARERWKKRLDKYKQLSDK
ncbi:MAG: hemolysin [Bacteroidetes bacterium GWE2_39_28]|nr:MAG: hemolysin [Bacteroidetes bacterium GWE2_39_28]OFY12037.1 MAG: hemolysin [Bacteroidetes bacterium GWF2_39_10]OFZ11292.1 MAG: hemolysin [Bacteroidetes bacterium RIFOXYC2_FULL_39_11]HCT95142.1 hemolysin [Rikenellaceae bacterium]HCV15636.1 hemolysin [Rikenellaceae bacterium]